ncbi:IS1595 family transposase [Phocaeicola coprophilus]|uniref:IS1595 family transposase n=1 Tax=Phocaeicola coprophilus TaxID=387090 RepID=UPI002659FCBB|nr:IS1595 family transposase [Phocaeicola coprophilus]
MSTKKSFSTEEIRRQLGHKRYQPVWEMVCKLRDVMGKRDAQYSLDGQVELDDGFFTTERPEEEKDTPLKRGRGSHKKSKMVVMVESAPSQRHPRKGKPSKVVGHLKMHRSFRT